MSQKLQATSTENYVTIRQGQLNSRSIPLASSIYTFYSMAVICLIIIAGHTQAAEITHKLDYSKGAILHSLIISREGYQLKPLFSPSETQPGKLILTRLITLAEKSEAVAAINGTIWEPRASWNNLAPSGYYGSYNGAYLHTTLIDSGDQIFEPVKDEAVMGFQYINDRLEIERHENGNFEFDPSKVRLSAFGSPSTIMRDSECVDNDRTCEPAGDCDGGPAHVSAIGYSSDNVIFISSDHGHEEVKVIAQLCDVFKYHKVTDAVMLDGSSSAGLYMKGIGNAGILNGFPDMKPGSPDIYRFIAYGIGVFKAPSVGVIEKAFLDSCRYRYGGDDCNNLGQPVSDIHCWNRSNTACNNDVWIRDYKDFSNGKETALIYNPDQNEAWLMSEVFWAYYKMIGGNTALGAPRDDAVLYEDGAYRQYFQLGMLMWSPWVPSGGYTYPAWGITVYGPSGEGSGNTSTNPPEEYPISNPGERPDHTPDFDVFHQDGHEVSANCNNCPTEDVHPGQVVRMRLEAETHNRDVESFDVRNGKSQSIDGEIHCQVEGRTGWQEIPGSEDELEFDVKNLVTDNNSSVETISYTVPNYPGSVLACYAIVDADDEIIEEDEGNNRSRTERFFIVAENRPPTGHVDAGDCNQIQGWASDPDVAAPIWVHFYASGSESGGGQTYLGPSLAKNVRADVGEHGFSFPLPTQIKDGLPRTIHAYAINQPDGSNPEIGQWQVSCGTSTEELAPVYRMYSPVITGHFYTISESEKNSLGPTEWQFEGIGWYAHPISIRDSVPVYRFSSEQGHFFTIDESEKAGLIGNSSWQYEGVGFYAYSYPRPGTFPVHRFYSGENTDHYFTVEQGLLEPNSACTKGQALTGYTSFCYEGIAWYAYPTLPEKPLITLLDVSSIGQNTASLAAIVNPNGTQTSLSFELGVTNEYGQTKNLGMIGYSSSPISRSHEITGLQCNKAYYYRGRAENDAGISYSGGATFSTTACAIPDLVISSINLNNMTPEPSKAIDITASIRNDGGSASSSTVVRYYFSDDAVITNSDHLLGTEAISDIQPSDSVSRLFSGLSPTVPGTYWIGVCVDIVDGETNIANNCSSAIQITVKKAPLVLPLFENFVSTDHQWELEDHNNSASLERLADCGSGQGGCLRVSNSGVQTHGYEVQAKVVGIALQQGQAYRGRIRLKTDREEGIVVKAHRDIDPHDTFGLNHYCVANTQWQTCTFDFVAENHPEDDAGNVRFSLFLGEIVGNIWIDDFELVVKPNESIPFYENFDWGAHSMVLERPYNSGVTMDTSGDCGSTHSGCLVVTNDASYASTTDVQAKQVGFDIEQGKEHQGQLRLKTEQPSTVPVALMLNVSPYENLGLRIDCTTGFDWTACPFYFTPQGTDQYDGKDIRFTVKLGKIAGQTLIDEIKLQPVYHWPVSETFADDRHGWLLEDHGPSATMETLADCGGGRGGCLQITNAAVQDYGYSVQPQLLGMDIQYGERYQGQIRLRSELAASITIGFWLGVAPYDNLGMWEECETDSNWTTCSFDFIATVNKPYQPMDVRFAVQMGKVAGKVWIDDLWVERVEATPPPAPPALPIDEDFEGSHGWILEDHHSSAVMETRSDCGSGQGACLYVDNSVAQTHDYEVQAKLLGLDLKNGRRYTGQILLKAEHPGPIDIGAYMNVHPYTYLGLWATCEVGTQWTVCNLDFVAEIPSGVSPEDIRIAVMLGDVPGSVWIDDFQLREADGSGCTEGSTVERDITYPVNSVIKATGDISTSGAVVVNSGLDVEYRAERVTLNPGFYAKAGSTFTAVAETVSCGGGL